MGYSCNSCKTCDSCTDQVYDFILADSHIEKFQNKKIKFCQLDKYDQFYRMVSVPLIEL
jgi:hypothetical protein